MRSNTASKTEFFEYFERRLRNLRVLQSITTDKVRTKEELDLSGLKLTIEKVPKEASIGTSFNPESMVLVGSYLDSLAVYWDNFQGKKTRPNENQKRVGEFLSSHGDPDIWNKINPIDLLLNPKNNRKEVKDPTKSDGLEAEFPPMVYLPPSPLKVSGNSRVLILPKRDRKDWSSDPTLSKVFSSLNPYGWTEDEIKRSRYGEIFYREFRNQWTHKLDPGPRLDETWFSKGPPSYEYYMGELRFSIPLPFLIDTLEAVINSMNSKIPHSYIFNLS